MGCTQCADRPAGQNREILDSGEAPGALLKLKGTWAPFEAIPGFIVLWGHGTIS